MHSAPTMRRPVISPRGFTLLEMLITLVVAAILLTVALPSFIDSVRKGRRSEAMTGLATVQQAQERWRGNQAAYTNELGEDGLKVAGGLPATYYTFNVPDSSASGYTATAVGKSGTSQADDAQCSTLSMKMDGGNLSYAGCGGGSCTLTYAATHACWAK